jgi:hypothetical protein
VDVILASGPEVTLQAARKATATVPIVIAAVDYDGAVFLSRDAGLRWEIVAKGLAPVRGLAFA